MNSNNPIITVLLLIAAIMSTVGYFQDRVEKPDSLQKAVSSLSDNVEKLANADVEMVVNVKEIRTEVDADKAFELLTKTKTECVSIMLKLKEHTGYDGEKLKEMAGDICKSINVELDGEGRYWLIETNKEGK